MDLNFRFILEYLAMPLMFSVRIFSHFIINYVFLWLSVRLGKDILQFFGEILSFQLKSSIFTENYSIFSPDFGYQLSISCCFCQFLSAFIFQIQQLSTNLHNTLLRLSIAVQQFQQSNLYQSIHIIKQQYLTSNHYSIDNPIPMSYIYDESSSDADSIAKSQSTSQVRSLCSKLSHGSSAAEVARFQLLNYQDICDDDFVLLPSDADNQKARPSNSDENEYSSYMHYYATEVPIGPTYQAIVPPIIGSNKYKRTYCTQIISLKQRKIHDMQIDSLFYNRYINVVQNLFGSDRNYEDVNLLRISFHKKSDHADFQDYLKDEQVFEYWEEYFDNKDKTIAKMIAKRRKKRRIMFKI